MYRLEAPLLKYQKIMSPSGDQAIDLVFLYWIIIAVTTSLGIPEAKRNVSTFSVNGVKCFQMDFQFCLFETECIFAVD